MAYGGETMQNENKNSLFFLVKKHQKLIFALGISAAFPLIWLLVYYTGGIKFVYSHTMYIPILLAGIVFGFKVGVLAGIIGGFLLGPLMPLVVDPLEQQEFINWFYRMLMFVVIGGLSGYFVEKYKKIIKINNRLFSRHPDTGIHNINYLLQLEDDFIEDNVITATVMINNKSRICEVIGTDYYIKTIKELIKYLKNILPKETVIIQADSDKFWFIIKVEGVIHDGADTLKSLSNQFDIEGITVYLDYSIGVNETTSFKTCKTLIPFRDSDRLAGYAKENNLPFVIFDNELLKRRFEFSLLGQFLNALEKHETFLVFQPIIDSKTEKVEKVEALIRWNNSVHGMIMPNDFIPLIESTQLVHPLTDWVIKEALIHLKKLQDLGFDICISINLSPKNLNNPNFYDSVVKIVKEQKVLPEKIVFEVTESFLLEEEMKSKSTLDNLKAAGFRIAIDDFGKGYSSLTYLSQFDTDFLKIDQYYINNILEKPTVLNIVDATIKLAHQFNLKVVAEGVESKSIFEKAKSIGIDYIQGYYISKPLTFDKLVEWMTKHK
jgi:EAL domain-containing protein (putative c-di-GMP-specific phosphodiesterase class I)